MHFNSALKYFKIEIGRSVSLLKGYNSQLILKRKFSKDLVNRPETFQTNQYFIKDHDVRKHQTRRFLEDVRMQKHPINSGTLEAVSVIKMMLNKHQNPSLDG